MNDSMIEAATEKIPARPLYDFYIEIPPTYDLSNHILTWGLHRRWRRAAARECIAARPGKMLDLCCGTGDLTVDIFRQAGYGIDITGFDYSKPMLDIAARKTASPGKKPTLVRGYADALPFADNYFDCVGISFAFRNLTYRNPLAQANIAEVFRVLAPGGKFVIVETSQPRSRFIRKLFHLYLRRWVRPIGSMVSGNQMAYRYLAESAARYYDAEYLKQMLLTAGFSRVSARPFLFGAISLHVAVK
ncbi:MAG: ubiquinone/menaquinone biosynthesis methyltransferase [Chloroflexi bacterium]|nr:ubiquinone/menaquinone biosynthesis methyltransferase [Chloroflexota bacterium]